MASDYSRPQTHLAACARRQYGLFRRDQALDAGLSDDQIRYRVKHGHWEAVDSGVYRIAGTPEGWHARLMAACLAGPAVVSHRSAATLWHLPGFGQDIVEVTAFRHRRRRSRDVVWHESYHLGAQDVTTIAGLPTTRPQRTLIDLAATVKPEELERAVDEALRKNLTGLEQIARRLDELGLLRRGHSRMRQLLERPERLGATESALETHFLQLVRTKGLPEPALQLRVPRPNGTLARIDCAYPDHRIAIELEGGQFHSGRIDRQRDSSRQNDIVLADWRVLRFTWEDVTRHAERVASQVRRALDASPDGTYRSL